MANLLSRIPSWLFGVTKKADDEKSEIIQSDKYFAIDPTSFEKREKPITTLMHSSDTLNAILIFWNDSGNVVFEKKFENRPQTLDTYKELSKKLQKITDLIQEERFDLAQEESKSFFDEIHHETGKINEPVQPITRTMASPEAGLEISKGFALVSSFNHESLIEFSDEFVRNVIVTGKLIETPPLIRFVNKPSEVYSTVNKSATGKDDYVACFWKRAETLDGKILRNIVQVERLNNRPGIICFAKLSNISEFVDICDNLTVQPERMGYYVDKVGKLRKTPSIPPSHPAKVVGCLTPQEADKRSFDPLRRW